MKKPTIFLYLLSQMIPTFIIGILIFIFILLMFQFLRLTELILAHDVSAKIIFWLIINMTFSFLPIILPMSLLFSVLLTYSRLSADSEMVALRALGYSTFYLSMPAILFSSAITLLAAQTLFILGPRARNDLLTSVESIGRQKIISGLSAGTFSESFFGLVIYTNELNQKTNQLKDLFIFDSRNPSNTIAIVAKEGLIKSNNENSIQTASLTLNNGDIFKMSNEGDAKINFDTYNLSISSPIDHRGSSRDPDTYEMRELSQKLDDPKMSGETRRAFEAEYHRRWATAFSCLVFGLLGAGLGAKTNRRSNASSGFVVSVMCIIVYWAIYAVGMNFALNGHISAMLGLWLPNILFILIAMFVYKKQSLN